jgi:hypothetical protein
VVEALNEGLRAASGDVVVQLDADASVETPGWVERMRALLETDEQVGIVTGRVALDDGTLHAAGVTVVAPEGLHDRGTDITEPVGRRRYHSRVRRPAADTAPLAQHAAEVDAGIGCCMMYRRDDALAAGGYDTGFSPVWFDDLDLGLALRRQGKKNFFLPDVHVTHHVFARGAGAAGPADPVRRALSTARRQAGAWVAPEAREAIVRRTGLDRPPKAHRERLAHHYAYWQRKWGWDPLNPDVAKIGRRYAGTDIPWSLDPESVERGQRILGAFEAAHGSSDSARSDVERELHYLDRYGFLPPPRWSVLADYRPILDVIEQRGLTGLDGDFVEIGVLLGGGTYQLAKLLERRAPGRRMIAIDIFDPSFDLTESTDSRDMAGIYAAVLGRHEQRALYDAVVAGCPNVITVVGDSAKVDVPTDRVAFAHIDGNHDAAYVRSDFELLWRRTVPGGVVAFDDYGHDLPEVTATIDALRDERAAEIGDFWTAGLKTAFIQRQP